MQDSTDGLTDGERDYLARERGRQLWELRWHWYEAYKITWEDGKFRAARLDDGSELVADTVGELRELIICDYSERRVPRPPI